MSEPARSTVERRAGKKKFRKRQLAEIRSQTSRRELMLPGRCSEGRQGAAREAREALGQWIRSCASGTHSL